MPKSQIRNFYINEEQSIYLLSHHDAKKHKQWLKICAKQLELLGYSDVSLIGSGAFGFVFKGVDESHQPWVFKFSRITLAQSVRDKLEDEGYMLSQINNAAVPDFYAFVRVKKQGILMMGLAKGIDLEKISLQQGRLSARFIVDIALQLRNLLLDLRLHQNQYQSQPIVHGDIKPSNLMWDSSEQQLALIDWGSSVFAQIDHQGNPVSANIMDLMSHDANYSNARMGDVYFIGDEQMKGHKSSPRFDEQGVASTLYALASGQSCRYGHYVIPAKSLGLPKALAYVLDGMLSDDKKTRDLSGDYFIKHMPSIAKAYLPELPLFNDKALVPFWQHAFMDIPDTVVYTSRKQFLRQADKAQVLQDVDDEQLDRYYKEFLLDMGDTEKAFLASISRLSKYPVVGGLSFHWKEDKLYVESNLVIDQSADHQIFLQAINNTIKIAQGITQKGLFKCCLFDARHTIQLDRDHNGAFIFDEVPKLHYSVADSASTENIRPHSYFEDGKDPDEQLTLPKEILKAVFALNEIHHTGCIIVESLPERIKIHHYYRLLDHTKEQVFQQLLDKIMTNIVHINDVGVAGFMKLPYKNTREFELVTSQPELFYPKNPKTWLVTQNSNQPLS